MILSLSHLSVPKGAKKRKKRIGRGDGSGHGTYSTRGIKGQKSRSGVGGLKRLGLRHILLASPKFKGQKPVHPKMVSVSLNTLEKIFSAGKKVDATALVSSRVIRTDRRGIKILGEGKLSKPLIVVADAFSKKAREAILKAGGKAIVSAKGGKS